MNTPQNESPFGEVIYSYTRKQAIADGFQVEVTKTAQEAGIHANDTRITATLARTPCQGMASVSCNGR